MDCLSADFDLDASPTHTAAILSGTLKGLKPRRQLTLLYLPWYRTQHIVPQKRLICPLGLNGQASFINACHRWGIREKREKLQ